MSTRQVVVNGRFLEQPFSGVQRYAVEMLRAMDDIISSGSGADYPNVTVLTPRSAPDTFPGRGLVNVGSSRVGRLGGNLWTQIELPRLSRDSVLWSPTNSGPIAAGKRHIVTVHDAAVFDHPEWFSRKFAAWYRFMLPQVVRKAHKVLTVSEFSRARLTDTLGLPVEKVAVLPPAANTEAFRPLEENDIRHSLDALDLARPYVLALGSLEPRKNLAGLIDAWRHLTKEGRIEGDLKLFVAGGRAPVFRDAGLTDLPDNVVLGGFVDDEHLPALYCGAEAFVYPSLYEGFGLPPLEAMACGTPVLTSNVASLPEVVGDCAVMVEPSSRSDIATGMERILTDEVLRESLVRNGREQALRFDWSESASSMLRYLVEAGR